MNQCQTGDLSRVHAACRHMAAGLPPTEVLVTSKRYNMTKMEMVSIRFL